MPIIREAIAQRVAEGRDGDFTIDGYCVLVSREPETPDECWEIGLYLPGSTPEGMCDAYHRCTADGEAVAT